MTLELRGVSIRTRRTISPVALTDLNFKIERTERVALLGPPNSGVDLLTDVICGAKAPDAGKVIRSSSISWALPTATFLHKHQNFIANARFVARLYGTDQKTYVDRVLETAELGDLAAQRLDHCSGKTISRFVFVLGISLPFDIYLFANTGIGEKHEREKYAEMIADLADRNGIIIATTNGKSAAQYCDRAIVLDPAGAVPYDDMEAALEHLERISKRAGEADEVEFPDEEEAASGFDDF